MHKHSAFAFLILFELVFIPTSYSQRLLAPEPEQKKVDFLKKLISDSDIKVVLAFDYPHNEYNNSAEAVGLPDEILFSNESITIKGSYFDFENKHFVHYIYSRDMGTLYQYKFADLPADCGMTTRGLLLFFYDCANTIYTSATFDMPGKKSYAIF